jgi:hypothetical protein
MQITDILQQSGGLRSIARELGISESQAASGAAALAPAILGGFKKQAQAQPGGLEGLGAGAQTSSSGGGLGGLLGGLLGGQGGGLGGLASMLDMDRDGNPLDDIIGMVTKRGR